jgi:hypothetical protein
MEIGEFVEYMFVGNTSDRPIYMDLVGIENNKDLFLFFLDLFCKGLIAKYGNGSSSVNFDDLDVVKFTYLKRKMALAGIILHLDIIQTENAVFPTAINSEELDAEDDNKPLESYKFKIPKTSIQ